MKFTRNAKLYKGQLDAGPFAGVFFILVMFLVFHSSLVFTPGLRINLPETTRKDLPGISGPSAVVAMDISGNLFFENQIINESSLKDRLRTLQQKNPGLVLIIQADQSVKLEYFFRLSKLAQDAGISEVLMASHPPMVPGANPMTQP